MTRRDFITLFGGAAAAWLLAAEAQQAAIPVVGLVHTLSPESVPHFVAAFQQGLKEVGYVEGQNLAVEYRWAQGRYDQLPGLIDDLGATARRRHSRDWRRSFASDSQGGNPNDSHRIYCQ